MKNTINHSINLIISKIDVVKDEILLINDNPVFITNVVTAVKEFKFENTAWKYYIFLYKSTDIDCIEYLKEYNNLVMDLMWYLIPNYIFTNNELAANAKRILMRDEYREKIQSKMSKLNKLYFNIKVKNNKNEKHI